MQDMSRPVSFRSEIINKLLKTLQQGSSCSLTGVSSSGKSNIARHLRRADVREYHLGEDAQYLLNLYVNCAELIETDYTAHALYRRILEAMGEAVEEAQPHLAARSSEMRALWKEAIEAESVDLARNNVKVAFNIAFRTGIEQVFITLDDFDDFFARAPASALKSLRALRDDYKGKLMYLTVTRRELGYLRDPNEVEDFFELVVPTTTFAAGSYSLEDALSMIRQTVESESPPRGLSDQEQERVIKMSGRHPGLIRMICRVTRDRIPLTSNNLLERLQNHPAIVEECEKIWASLEQEEQRALEAVVSEHRLSSASAGALLGKGILEVEADDTCAVSSPLLGYFVADFVKQQLPIKVLSEQQQIKVRDRAIRELSAIEYHLLSYMIDQYPKPVTWGQLLEEMHIAERNEPQPGGPPGRRLANCLSEIKRKIEFDDQEYITQLPDGRLALRRP